MPIISSTVIHLLEFCDIPNQSTMHHVDVYIPAARLPCPYRDDSESHHRQGPRTPLTQELQISCIDMATCKLGFGFDERRLQHQTHRDGNAQDQVKPLTFSLSPTAVTLIAG